MIDNISILIPIYNEEQYISKCIESILESDYSKENMEIILIDGGSDDNTLKIIDEYHKKYDFIKVLHNKEKIVPISMNLGIREAKGEYIIRLDAHASYPKDYFSKLVKYHKELGAANVGATILTDIRNKNIKSNAIKLILSQPFGVGNSDFRTGVTKIKEVDTVPFGCFHRSVFKQFGFYDERLVRNQDIELNKRIINGGGKIYLIPDVQCTYYARENFTDLAKNNFDNGKWNILTAYYTKTLSSLSLRHFIPLIFVLSLFMPLLLVFVNIKFLWITLLSLGSYLALVIILSLKLRKNSRSFLYLISSFLTLHLSYGVGSLVGIFTVLKKIIKGTK